MPKYIYQQGQSNKFWSITRSGSVIKVKYGRIGSKGQSSEKDHGSPEKAKKEYEKLINAKLKKGYVKATAATKSAKPAANTAAEKMSKSTVETNSDYPFEDGWFRLEFKEGGSHKFWAISQAGTNIKTVYGRVGSKGQLKEEAYPYESTAKSSLIKSIIQKIEKGYQPALQFSCGCMVNANSKMENAIISDPGSDDGYLVYGDWLQTKQDPRGELIAVDQVLAKGGDKTKYKKIRWQLLSKYGDYFIPKFLLDEEKRPIEGRTEYAREASLRERPSYEWKLGFFKKIRVTGGPVERETDMQLLRLLIHPSSRLLQELIIGPHYQGNEYGELVDIVSALAPKSLRRLYLVDMNPDAPFMWHEIYDVEKLYKKLPHLTHLHLKGDQIYLGKIILPKLETFIYQSRTLYDVESVARAKWPNLKYLELWLGPESCSINDLKPLFQAKTIDCLKHLGLLYSDLTDDICEALAKSKILTGLESLDLSMGTMTDNGAQTIISNKKAFKHLRKLNVSGNFLSPDMKHKLEDAVGNLEFDFQNEVDEDEGYYVSVME